MAISILGGWDGEVKLGGWVSGKASVKPNNRKESETRSSTGLPRERIIHLLEIAGGALLLFSFVIQNYLYDNWNSRSNELESAMLSQAVVDKSVQLNEILYFVIGQESDLDAAHKASLREGKIREAARKLFVSTTIPIAVSDLPLARKKELVVRLQQLYPLVHDYDSFLRYVQLVNAANTLRRSPADLRAEISGKRDMARAIFLATYILGAISVLFGVTLKR